MKQKGTTLIGLLTLAVARLFEPKFCDWQVCRRLGIGEYKNWQEIVPIRSKAVHVLVREDENTNRNVNGRMFVN